MKENKQPSEEQQNARKKYEYYICPEAINTKLKRADGVEFHYWANKTEKKWCKSVHKRVKDTFIPVSEKWAILHYPEAF